MYYTDIFQLRESEISPKLCSIEFSRTKITSLKLNYPVSYTLKLD